MASSTDLVRVILVEDEFLVAMHVEDLLEGLGYEIVGVAARVDEAVGLVQATPNFDLAVLDVNLAGEMSWPVARACRARAIPFLFATGYLHAHAQLPEDLAGAPILSKPLDATRLRTEVEVLLGVRASD